MQKESVKIAPAEMSLLENPPVASSVVVSSPVEAVLSVSHYEDLARAEGAMYIVGIDEAGRGPLAGPVAAAAVRLPEGFDPKGIKDSKKMSAQSREIAFERIMAEASVGVALVHADEIDRLNILRATHEAMRRALKSLTEILDNAPDVVYVDGLPVPNLHSDCRNLIKGDARCLSIAAASIIAKVTRDRLLCGEYDAIYPEYGFARHKGYPSPEHLAALAQYGPCPLHRRTFGPVAQLSLYQNYQN
jgi:ribonuclease HII